MKIFNKNFTYSYYYYYPSQVKYETLYNIYEYIMINPKILNDILLWYNKIIHILILYYLNKHFISVFCL